MKTYTPTIGLEIHAELKTLSKMFCASKNAPHEGEPNTHVCPICMGHPGTLPVINKNAVSHVLKVGVALGGTLATFTEFDRKNYFYPDIPKGYQISQYLFPLVSGGALNNVKITRIHLEEDTARSLHDQGDGSIVDYNRAGVPLMELVTEPVIHDAKTAGNFAKELQLLLRTLGVSDANMEKGEMRVEANISVSPDSTFGTKVEVKNLNSFKSVEGAIEYEVKRQITVLEEGGKVVQETRGWDETKGKTFSQRVKESANDYRYFPEPDLPKLSLGESELLEIIISSMPELPQEKREKYRNLGLTSDQIETIIGSLDLAAFFESAIKTDQNLSKLIANYLVTDVTALLQSGYKLSDAHVVPFTELIAMVGRDEISSRVAKDLLKEVLFDGVSPLPLVTERGLLQSSNTVELLPMVQSIIDAHPQVVSEYRAGKVSVLQFLVGQGMKESKGSAKPIVLAELFKQILG